MSNTNTGGPAFPVFIVDRPKKLEHFNGMTLRDYFASAAMQGMVSNPVLLENGEFSDQNIRMAYEVADSMLKARES